ncbi:hypothetical protein CQA4T8M7_13070 [Sphaerotilus natans]|nr:hypothetical protein CQA4T8M7_13070 [Sphaerotilus natans]
MSKFNRVAWAVPPRKKVNTRPVKFIAAMNELGILSESTKYFFHGRSISADEYIGVGSIAPVIKKSMLGGGDNLCVFSPIFAFNLFRDLCGWVDMYDDWSIAPDINILHRLYASTSYYLIGKKICNPEIITCNTKYMYGKIGLNKCKIVPNGVDEDFSRIVKTGDNKRRLIVLGHFFDGRTDFELIFNIINSGAFEHVVFGGVAGEKKIINLINQIKSEKNIKIDVVDWISTEYLASISGACTVGIIPSVVSDYTLSQDPMKLYQFYALGIGVICPRLLWPDHIENKFAFLVDYGVDLSRERICEWINYFSKNNIDREKFCLENSWKSRVRSVFGC